MNNFIHFLNGKFVKEDKLLISPRDLGFSRGFAVHDFIITYNNQPFKLTQHVDRLFKSAEIIGLIIPWSKEQIITWVKETLKKNDKDTEKMVTIFLTGGNGVYMYPAKTPTLIIMINDRRYKSRSEYEKGIKIKAVKYKRPYNEAKTNFYVEGVKQLSKVKNQDITEIIYYDDSQVFEGAGSNLFAIINNKLITAESNILAGITRKTILEEIKLDIPIEIRNFTFNELLTATEVFLTGSNSEVRGVVEINGKTVGDGKVGPITKEVHKQYREHIKLETGKKF